MSEEENIILPKGFKRVEYLESSGSQWLNLPITSKVGDKIVLETESKFLDTSNQSEGKNGNPYFFYGISGGKWYCGAGGYSTSSITADTEWHKFKLIHSQNDTGLYIDDIKIQSQIYNSTSIVLNGTISAYKTYNGNYYHKTRKKIWKLYINDELVYNLIPCLDENDIACMYDLVSQKPFYNQGTGKFLTNKDYKWNYPPINNNYNLPSGFRKCVYLQSDGTQYIDLDVYPNNETGLLIKAMAMGEANGCPMGSNNTTPYIYPPRKTLSSNKQIAYAWNNFYDSSILLNWDKADDLEYTSFVNYFNSRMVYFNSEDSDIIKPMNSDILPQLEINVRLFNWSVESSMLNSPWIGRIYRAQITQGSDLIHDYVPCLDADNRPCMYDLIEQETLYNQNGGTEFTYCIEHQLPSDFVKLKYLEASGTQFIKTGYVPTNNTGLYVDTYCVINGGTNGVESGLPMSIRETNGSTYVSAPRLGKTNGQETGYGWNSFILVGGYGDSRYEGYLNWLNNKKYNVKSPLYAEKVGNLTELLFTPTFDLCMFGNHNYDGKYVGSDYRIYRAKISEGDQIVRDFVPAFDQVKLKPCMYDLINNVAYYNDGEGEFLYNNDFEGTYKGYTGLSVIGNRLSGNCYHLVNALITDGNCRINLGKGIIDSNISHDFRGYTTNSGRFMFGTSTSGADCFWQGDGILVWGGVLCTVVSNSDVIVVVDDKNNKVRYNDTIITKNANFTSDKQTSIFDVGRADTEKIFRPAANGSKFYKWVMKKDNEIIHDYRPAVDNNSTPCVLDTITGEAFYNSLSGVLSWE